MIREVREREVRIVKTLVMDIVRNWYRETPFKDALIYEGVNLGEPLEYPLFGSLINLLVGALLDDRQQTDHSD